MSGDIDVTSQNFYLDCLHLSFKLITALVCLALPAGARDIPIWWSAQLHLASLQDIPERLNTPLPMLGYPADMKGVDLTKQWAGKPELHASTCSEFIKAEDAGYFPGNNFEVRRANVFVDECYVLYYLQRAKPAKQSFIHTGGWSREMFSDLPPLFEVEAGVKAWPENKSWQELSPHLRVIKITSDVLTAEDDGFNYEVDLLARGDFTGESNEDLAVSVWILAKRGTLQACQFFILTKLGDQGPMRIVVHR